jgi:hypothetical protein
MDPGLMYKSRVSGSRVSESPMRKSLGSVSWIRGVNLWGCVSSQYDSRAGGIWASGEKISMGASFQPVHVVGILSVG